LGGLKCDIGRVRSLHTAVFYRRHKSLLQYVNAFNSGELNAANVKLTFLGNTENFTINNVSHDTHLDKDVEEYLKSSFSFEIELYLFIKQRLYKQYIAVHKNEF